MFEAIVRNWWVYAVRGTVAILIGMAAFAWPHATLLAVVTLFGAFALIDGIMALFALPILSGSRYFWWFLVEGLLGIAVGALTFFYPGATALGLLILLGAWFVVVGAFRIALAIEYRKHLEHDWVYALGGALSVITGIVTLAAPSASAVAWVWLIGIYAILYGVLMLVVGFKLHSIGTHFPKATAAS